MPKIRISNLPSGISEKQLKKSLSLLNRTRFFKSAEQITLSYLGGITNHGLKDNTRNLFIRVPGRDSGHLIDRRAEADTITKLVSHSLYPGGGEVYSEGEMSGYKVEPFIEGETLQFDTFHMHQQQVLPVLKQLHDSNIEFNNEFNIFTRLNLMSDTLQVNGIQAVPCFADGHLSSIALDKIKVHIEELHRKMSQLFCKQIALSPCHNDITPTNFIKLASPVAGRNYQIIDWEYAGMNDRMYDLAILAAMSELTFEQQTAFALSYFNSQDEELYAEEIKRLQFYTPLVKLYYGLWSALQIAMCNESTSINELREGWGPQSISVFLEQYHSDEYQAIINGEYVNCLMSRRP
ncbi:phosphotransferase [Legionella dresdenensis]|uniref:Phosphotransferase n=1 Tax=Legionella dresdenensis TaxID=450200 RepID=A0ABV8CCL0_9GAMM